MTMCRGDPGRVGWRNAVQGPASAHVGEGVRGEGVRGEGVLVTAAGRR